MAKHVSSVYKALSLTPEYHQPDQHQSSGLQIKNPYACTIRANTVRSGPEFPKLGCRWPTIKKQKEELER